MITLTPVGWTIIGISIFLSVLSALIRRATIDTKKIKESQKKVKDLQTKLKEHQKKGDTQEMMRCQEEMMKLMMENLRMNFNIKTMLTMFLPFMIIFAWLNQQYGNSGTVATIIGFELTWFWLYLIVSLLAAQIMNKLMQAS